MYKLELTCETLYYNPYSLLQGNPETPEQLVHQEPPDELLQADFMEVSIVLHMYVNMEHLYSV